MMKCEKAIPARYFLANILLVSGQTRKSSGSGRVDGRGGDDIGNKNGSSVAK